MTLPLRILAVVLMLTAMLGMTTAKAQQSAPAASPAAVPATASSGELRIGSKRFTESYILAEVMAQTAAPHLQKPPVVRQGLGNTAIVYSALRSGDIDLYAEYTGTIALEILKGTAPGNQAMTREAGFDVKIQSTEFATSLNMADQGDFEALVLAWSGRPDPDGNLFSFYGCKQPLNYTGYCDAETDKLLAESRSLREPAERRKVFEQIAARALKDRSIVYLYHRNWLWAYNPKLTGVRNIPDGLLRVSGLKIAP